MIRIKKLDIFIVKQFGLLFAGTFFISQFVLMMQFLWKYVDELIGKGLSLDVLAQFFWYMGLMLVPQALPLAILLSSLMTFGNLGESSELTAIKAAGVSCVIAETFARIFYRNAINIGLPIIECPEAAKAIEAGDEVEVDFDSGIITDKTKGTSFQGQAFPEFMQKIIKAEGLINYINAK